MLTFLSAKSFSGGSLVSKNVLELAMLVSFMVLSKYLLAFNLRTTSLEYIFKKLYGANS